MSVALELVGPEGLAALAQTANREHALAETAAISAVEHALLAGDALCEARKQVPHGEWRRWLEVNFNGSRTTAFNYMRLSAYRDLLPASGTLKMGDSLRALRGLPAPDGRRRRTNRNLHARRRALRLARQEEAVRRVKGPGSEAWALLRRALQLLDRAETEAQSAEARREFNAAYKHLYPALDATARGIGVE